MEKYFKINENIDNIHEELADFKQDVNNFFTVMNSLKDESYVRYAQFMTKGVSEILLVQADDLLLEFRDLYNNVVRDLPVVDEYVLSESDFNNAIETVDT